MTKAILLGVMTAFVGTKSVLAVPMTRGDYNEYRGWQIPENEDPKEQGYLIEYVDGGKPNDDRHAGYISWSPKDVFERSYKAPNLNSNLTFGEALEHLKKGARVARSGWNGKGMWLSISRPEPFTIPAENFWSPHNRKFAEENGGQATVLPSITMKTATGEILMGWLASQTDMLAEDWMILS